MAKFNITDNTENLLKALSYIEMASNSGLEAMLNIYGEKAADEWADEIGEAKRTIEEALLESIKAENYKNNNNI